MSQSNACRVQVHDHSIKHIPTYYFKQHLESPHPNLPRALPLTQISSILSTSIICLFPSFSGSCSPHLRTPNLHQKWLALIHPRSNTTTQSSLADWNKCFRVFLYLSLSWYSRRVRHGALMASGCRRNGLGWSVDFRYKPEVNTTKINSTVFFF
jgi:hypothetical protein